MGKVDKAKWQATANLLSKAINGRPARLEVVSPKLGAQVEAEWTPLLGVAYDPKDDLFEILLQGVDHMVLHPRLFAIRERNGLADSLAVVDRDGAEHIVQLRDPVALPQALV